MDKFFPKIYLRDYVEYVKLYLAFWENQITTGYRKRSAK